MIDALVVCSPYEKKGKTMKITVHVEYLAQPITVPNYVLTQSSLDGKDGPTIHLADLSELDIDALADQFRDDLRSKRAMQIAEREAPHHVQ